MTDDCINRGVLYEYLLDNKKSMKSSITFLPAVQFRSGDIFGFQESMMPIFLVLMFCKIGYGLCYKGEGFP